MPNLGSLKRRCFGWMCVPLLIVMVLPPKTAQAAGIRHIVIPASDNKPKIVAELDSMWTFSAGNCCRPQRNSNNYVCD
jgi:hypothetical protein